MARGIDMNEEYIVKLLQKKDEKGLDILIHEMGKTIYKVLKSKIYKDGINEDIEEIFYDVIMSVWKSIVYYDESKGSLKNFVISITKYKAIDFIRKNKKRTEESLIINSDSEYIWENYVDTIIEKDEFDKLLLCLNDFDKQIFIQRYYFDEDIKIIAKSTGKTEEYIYTRLSRGRKKIKDIIEVKQNE